MLKTTATLVLALVAVLALLVIGCAGTEDVRRHGNDLRDRVDSARAVYDPIAKGAGPVLTYAHAAGYETEASIARSTLEGAQQALLAAEQAVHAYQELGLAYDAAALAVAQLERMVRSLSKAIGPLREVYNAADRVAREVVGAGGDRGSGREGGGARERTSDGAAAPAPEVAGEE